MGDRRSPDRVAAERDWRRLVERNAAVIAAAGLPPLATASVIAWDDFLTHGWLPRRRPIKDSRPRYSGSPGSCRRHVGRKWMKSILSRA